MRKIDIDVVNAVVRHVSQSIGNTLVYTYLSLERTDVELHGNRIASFFFKKGYWDLTTCGYCTQVTLRRLNALLQKVCGHPRLRLRVVDGDTHLFYGVVDMGPRISLTSDEWDELFKANREKLMDTRTRRIA